MNTKLKEIKDLVARGKYDDAVNALQEYAENVQNPKIQNEILMICAQQRSLDEERRFNLSDANLLGQRQNKLTFQILELLVDLENGKRVVPTVVQSYSEDVSDQKQPYLKWAGISLLAIGLFALFMYLIRKNETPEINEPLPEAMPLDLEVLSFKQLGETKVNTPFTIQATVRNNGQQDVKNVLVHFLTGENNSEPEIKTIDLLEAEKKKDVKFNLAGYSKVGSYSTRVEIDPTQLFKETNESNNSLNKQIHITENNSAGTSPNDNSGNTSPPPPEPPKYPDLAVTSYKISPSTPIQGEKVNITAIIKNQGDTDAQNVLVQWWAGVNFPSPSDSKTIALLKANTAQTITFEYSGYKSWYAKLQSKLVLDSNNSVSESNENNNVFTHEFSVEKKSTSPGSIITFNPDLIIESITFNPVIPIKGKQTKVTVTIKNSGTATAKNFKVKWWPGANYPAVGKEWKVSELAANKSMSLTFTYAGYPSHYSTITTKAVIDTDNSVKESSESNNEFTKQIRVRIQ